MTITTSQNAIDQGDQLAVSLSLTGDATPDVSAYLHQQGLPVKTLLDISPADGPGPTSLTGPGQTLSWARNTLHAIRTAARDHNGQVHLFMYASASAALFLGHIWNRVPTTQLYDDNLRGYFPTFTIAG